MKSIRILVSGVVQGVSYRAFTQEQARSLGLCGRVKNLPTGQVEIAAQGEARAIEALEQWCWEGSPQSRVSDVQSRPGSEQDHYSNFTISY